MKRYINSTSNLSYDEGQVAFVGSAPTADRRNGLVKFSTGKNVVLSNGAEMWLRSAKPMINMSTGDIITAINVSFELDKEDKYYRIDYDSLTPEEFKEVYIDIQSKTYEELVEFGQEFGYDLS